MKPSLCILAAGIGSRFGGLKQMQAVGPRGELLIDYAISDARKAGFERFVFVISKQIERDFKGHMETRYGAGAGFVYAYQELGDIPEGYKVPEGRVKPWGTVQAVLAARKAVGGVPFGVINADDYYGPRSFAVLFRALETMPQDSREFVMVGFVLSKTLSEHGVVARGVCTVENGYLASIVEREKVRRSGNAVMYETASGESVSIDPRSVVSMNFWGFAPQVLFPLLERSFGSFLERSGAGLKSECYLPTVINTGLAEKEVRVRMLYSGEQWFGMTYANDVEAVREYLGRKTEEGMNL
ncbi:MAG: NTP transferase domain-containing protein [Chitinispirillaceae bacterium]|nr:NTP transferase domain-containing protein [Chitinispirillaceae bacterium]